MQLSLRHRGAVAVAAHWVIVCANLTLAQARSLRVPRAQRTLLPRPAGVRQLNRGRWDGKATSYLCLSSFLRDDKINVWGKSSLCRGAVGSATPALSSLCLNQGAETAP